MDFVGEVHTVDPARPFVVGREGDLVVDDNPYLHRRLLVITSVAGLWWLGNAGSRLSATVSDADARMQAWLAPGARMPLVFARTLVMFTAGPTTYELELLLDDPPYEPLGETVDARGGTTIGRTTFTRDQFLLILATAEPALKRQGATGRALPSLAQVAQRLGWTPTRVNRKLDNVCQKLTKQGVKGLHGGPERLATDRRARLVEYALAARIVTAEDLPLLDRPHEDIPDETY
ncbi:MAG: hypothetical protein U0Q15_01425 [Kineosporiaceae bacterium]